MWRLFAFVIIVPCTLSSAALATDGDAARGQRVFRACAACHSLERDRNMTGPSLSGLWDRQAGGLQSFERYSPELKNSGIIWGDLSLDEWIKNPQHFIPGTTMTFPGLKDMQQRADLVAFLKEVTTPGSNVQSAQSGMMGSGRAPNLKKLDPEDSVQAIAHCRDTYRVKTADGKIHAFWERNLRFKTDSSTEGPVSGVPAIVGSGMMGDRASVIFAAPEEISRFITEKC
jgi:cytochrome c